MIQDVALGFESLDELDNGKIGAVLRQHLRRIAADCYDRPGDDKTRKVVVSFEVRPKLDEKGNAETVEVQIKCKSDVPQHQSKPYEMRITPNGLAYNPDSPGCYGQMALSFGEDDPAA